MELTDPSCPDSSSPVFYKHRPGEARTVLRDVLQREIASVHCALEAIKCGKQTEQQVPYVDRAAHILSLLTGKVRLMAYGSTASGEDKAVGAEVSLEQDFTPKTGLARLAVYLLVTRGRLSKILNKTTKKKLDIGPFLLMSESFKMRREKREFLEQNELLKATSIRRLYCSPDREWAARVLQVVAPHLEDISISSVGIAHLQILELMPRLRRVKFEGANGDFSWNDLGPFDWNDEGRFNLQSNDPQDNTRPFWLKELPSSDVGLIYISARLPRHLLLPLIVQHRQTLRELTLSVHLPQKREESDDQRFDWSCCCNDLPQRLSELLQRFSLPALRLVKLCRVSSHSEDEHATCFKQLLAVRRVLGPKVTVLCNNCG